MRERKRKSVVVIGAGIAGMTTALMLAKRGFEVVVHEARACPGGKARSYALPNTGTEGRLDLRGEHGFRFWPSFYHHVIATMAEIPQDPLCPRGPTLVETLVPCQEAGVAAADGTGLQPFLRRAPRTYSDIGVTLDLWLRTVGVKGHDLSAFIRAMLRYAFSCDLRRLERFEEMSWWDFHEADGYSPSFQQYFRIIPRQMVAMDCELASARTIGEISLQLTYDYAGDGTSVDRTLVGPTSDVLFDPWTAYLRHLGVRFVFGSRFAGWDFDNEARRVKGAFFEGSAAPVEADYFVLAVPLEVAARVVTDEMAEGDAQLSKLKEAHRLGLTDASAVEIGGARMVSWMNGLQIYLNESAPLVSGHAFFPDAPWALTLISQDQFWKDPAGRSFRDRYGNGRIGGVLSVDISDWNREGTFVRKPAKHCTKQEIWAEVWGQLKAGTTRDGRSPLSDRLVEGWSLDEDIVFPQDTPDRPINRSPLLVHPPGSWFLRPTTDTEVANLVLAGDYVQTHTVLASMEGADEAGRRAANVILDRSGAAATRCDVRALKEPAILRPVRALDERLYRRQSRDDEAPASLRRLWQDGPISVEEVLRLEQEILALGRGRR